LLVRETMQLQGVVRDPLAVCVALVALPAVQPEKDGVGGEGDGDDEASCCEGEGEGEEAEGAVACASDFLWRGGEG